MSHRRAFRPSAENGIPCSEVERWLLGPERSPWDMVPSDQLFYSALLLSRIDAMASGRLSKAR